MFGTIIDTDSSGNIKMVSLKYAKLCPEFADVLSDKNLGSNMMKYIINVYDRKSIYRMTPFDLRVEEVCLSIWGENTHPRLKAPKMLKAIELYQHMMYDPLIAQYDAMVNKSQKKVEIYNLMDVTESNFRTINSMETEMQKSTEGLEKLKERIKIEEDEREIMGSGTNDLSYIEEKLLKRKQHNN